MTSAGSILTLRPLGSMAEVWTDHLKKLQDCAPKDTDSYVKAMLEAGEAVATL